MGGGKREGGGVNTWRHIWLYQLYTELLTVIPDICQACVKFQLPAIKPKVDYADHAEWSGAWEMLSCTFWFCYYTQTPFFSSPLWLLLSSLLCFPFPVLHFLLVYPCSRFFFLFRPYLLIFLVPVPPPPTPVFNVHVYRQYSTMHETFDLDKVWCPFFHLHFLRSNVFIWHHFLTALWPHLGLVKSRNTAAQNSSLYRSTA